MLSYDPDTGVFRWLEKPNRCIILGSEAGTLQHTGYITITLKGTIYLAHRLAWYHFYGTLPGECIDHIDGDERNNAIANLRQASDSQNSANQRKLMGRNTSGFRGVTRNRKKKPGSREPEFPWKSLIMINGVRKFLGVFRTPEEAGEAYENEAKKHWGEFYSSASQNHGTDLVTPPALTSSTSQILIE